MSAGSAKEQAKERDGWECRFCGMDNETHQEQYGEGVHAHHIIKDSDGGADHPKNLITVCHECHTILEKTQANALRRIKRDHVERATKGVRAELEAAKERVEELEQREPEAAEVFAWFETRTVTLHILLEGKVNPTVRTFTDAPKAVEAYEEADGSVKLFDTAVTFADTAAESLRYVSTHDMELNVDPNGGSNFDSGNPPDTTEYWSGDIPEELAEQARDAAQAVEAEVGQR